MNGSVSMTHEEFAAELTAEKYILGELTGVARDRFEEHYFECAECAETVRLLSQLRAGAREIQPVENSAFEDSTSKRNPWWRGWWTRPHISLAGALAAFAFAAVIGFQNVQLRNQLVPQTVESLVLRPETLGEVPVLTPQHAGSFILLEADLPSASGRLNWTIQSKEGATLEGGGPAPQPGLSWKLLLPSTQLQTGEHTLSVRSSTGDEWMFRFETGAR